MSIVFDGRAFAQAKLKVVSQKVEEAQQRTQKGLTILSIYPFEDKASVLYTRLKKEDAAQVGIQYQTVPLSMKQTRHTWLRTVMDANHNAAVRAILVQKPSRESYAQFGDPSLDFSTWWQNIAEAISPAKDIDGLAPMTLFTLETAASQAISKQRYLDDLSHFLLPATAQAVIDIALCALGDSVSDLRTKKVAVIGRSVIVGRPAAAGFRLLGAETQLFSSQHDLAKELPQYDIVVSATGKSGLIQGQWLKQGSILVDVGAPVAEFQSDCYSKADFYTPVPYGVGPVTRACLLENMFKLL
jgi:5,10-methylene-tetrahydrofolate dehydrogenase/methenyl tetrahydrofolate cyclohydrolase